GTCIVFLGDRYCPFGPEVTYFSQDWEEHPVESVLKGNGSQARKYSVSLFTSIIHKSVGELPRDPLVALFRKHISANRLLPLLNVCFALQQSYRFANLETSVQSVLYASQLLTVLVRIASVPVLVTRRVNDAVASLPGYQCVSRDAGHLRDSANAIRHFRSG